MRELVVAHCNEDVSWIDRQPLKAMVYCKGWRIHGGLSVTNIGREGHTFALHVCLNWNYLADITIFAQGDPFPHCKDFITKMQEPFERFQWLSDDKHGCNHEGLPHRDMPLNSWYQQLMEQPFPNELFFYGGGQFMATRECLQSVPLTKWQWIISQANHQHFPWMMERCWGNLLNREPRFEQQSLPQSCLGSLVL